MVNAGNVWVKLGIKSTLGKDVAKADLALGKLRKSAKNTTANFKALGQSMTMYVGAPLLLIGGLMTKTAVDFDDAMRQVQAVTGATGDEFQDLTDLARDLGATTSFSAKQAAEGMIFLGRAGFTVNQIFSSLDDTLNLARATTTDLGTTADILSNIMTAFSIPAEDATRVVDVLSYTTASANTDLIQLGEAMKYVATVAAPMGMSLEDTAAAAGFLSNVGIQATMAGTSLKNILVHLASPTGTAKKALDQYGLSIEDVSPTTHNFVEILQTLEQAGVDITGTMEIFGLRGGPGMAAMLAKGKTALSDYTGELSNADGAAARMAKTMDEGPGGSIRMLKSALEGLKIEFGTIIAEGLMPVAEAAKWVTNAFTNLPGPIKKGIVVLGGLAIAAAGIVLAIGVLAPIISSAGAAFAAVSSAAALITPIFVGIGSAVLSLNPLLLAVVGAGVLLEKKFHVLSDTCTILWDGFKDVIPFLKREFLGAFEDIKREIGLTTDALGKMGDYVANFFGPTVKNKLGDALDSWHERAEDIRNKNKELAKTTDDVADSTLEAADAVNEFSDAIGETDSKIPGYAGHMRELLEAGLAGEAGFTGPAGIPEDFGPQKYMAELEREKEERLKGPENGPVELQSDIARDFAQMGPGGKQPFEGLDLQALQDQRQAEGLDLSSIIQDSPIQKTETNTKDIEKNTKDINTSTMENGLAIFQASLNIQKAVRESKPKSTGGFSGFIRSPAI